MAALRSWLQNPVFLREARVRMRGWRAPALVMVYVGVLGLISLFVLWLMIRESGAVFAPQLGGILFSVLAVVQMMLICFSAPGLTAGAISGERERQTLDLLLVTRLTPAQVVIGKLGAATGFTLLLMIASLPVYSLLFLFGGVSLYRLGLTALVYIVTVIYLGSMGVYFSAVFKRTQAAVVASYGTGLGLVVISVIGALTTQEILYRGMEIPPFWTIIFAWISPVFALSSAAGGQIGFFTTLYRKILTTPEAMNGLWWQYCVTALIISAWLLWRTSRRIQPLKEK